MPESRNKLNFIQFHAIIKFLNETHENLIIPRQNHDNHEIPSVPWQNHLNYIHLIVPKQNH